MGNGTGGEIFAKTAKTPPLQAGVGGDIIAIQIRPLPSSMETRKLYNDAARRVATSSVERENRFKPPYSKRENPSRGSYGFNLYRRLFPACA